MVEKSKFFQAYFNWHPNVKEIQFEGMSNTSIKIVLDYFSGKKVLNGTAISRDLLTQVTLLANFFGSLDLVCLAYEKICHEINDAPEAQEQSNEFHYWLNFAKENQLDFQWHQMMIEKKLHMWDEHGSFEDNFMLDCLL